MDFSLCFFLILSLFFTPSSSTPPSSISEGSSLSVDRPNDVLTSPNGVFTSGFYPVGDNAFIYAVWFAKSFDRTVVWTANRDQPVNGKGSKLLLQKGGELMLTDAGKNTVWTAATTTSTSVQLSLKDTGNLVLSTSSNTSPILWQSFDSPTNTLLPHQLFTRYTTLISSRSEKNYSSGFYKLFFDNNNVLELLYSGPEVSSIYWPDPWLMVWDTGRTTYNSSKVAVFNSSGHFRSSDNLEFKSSDSGLGPKRRLTLDTDGNLRLYSLNEMTGNWTITWQATSDPCRVHGICGPNSICSYGSGAGRGCFCVPGYRIRNSSDWSYGCELDQGYYLSGDDQTVDFVSMGYLELYGYEYDVFKNHTLKSCKEKCLNSAICKGFLFKFEEGVYNCYAKSQLLNGKSSPNLLGTLYVKLNVSVKDNSFKPSVKQIQLNCSGGDPVMLNRTYETKGGSKFLEFLAWFAVGVGVVEMLCVFTLCFFVSRAPKDSGPGAQGYFLAATTFRKFSFSEIKKATRGFKEEIGRGGYGVVYKGTLLDDRVAAIKRLNDAKEGEAEFLAEVSTIGRINHMNLIEMWGYCVEGKHRLLVSEYMEHGSLADNLNSCTLDSEKRFSIAVGIAKGLAYLHEECLEWVLHCDIKPQNILLDSNYQPKVADFGLSKLLNRGEGSNTIFSKMRGTRGYMAPEWVFNLPITSKVDVYSYGIVVLEMITGRSSVGFQYTAIDGGGLVTWMRKMQQGAVNSKALIKEIIDPTLIDGYDMGKMETLVRVAMQCVEKDKDARPTMRKVVEMLLRHEDEDSCDNGAEVKDFVPFQ
ncbi:putative receptor protein kinase ZmPK1 [Rhododendron vialii]|uniref:putative receptor protein kinase ZmPK1 n=1 Tax=Rhododendron vialii TaxID=182163 RepID=UPI00265F8FAF|nr:putative receptor protein kinase ZmPK1 [Rhododendron vialii]